MWKRVSVIYALKMYHNEQECYIKYVDVDVNNIAVDFNLSRWLQDFSSELYHTLLWIRTRRFSC